MTDRLPQLIPHIGDDGSNPSERLGVALPIIPMGPAQGAVCKAVGFSKGHSEDSRRGLTAGSDRAFDLATLLFYLYDHSDAGDLLRARLLDLTGPRPACAYLAHMLLRQVDWSLRTTLKDACTASKLIAWCLTWGSLAQLRRPVVLVDHATEDFASLDRQLQRRAGLVIVVGWSLLAGLVRAVAVVMAGVLAQNRAQVPFAVDEHPVGALASCGAYPSLGITVAPHRQLHPIRMIGTGVSG
jgi:hypothetical protein